MAQRVLLETLEVWYFWIFLSTSLSTIKKFDINSSPRVLIYTMFPVHLDCSRMHGIFEYTNREHILVCSSYDGYLRLDRKASLWVLIFCYQRPTLFPQKNNPATFSPPGLSRYKHPHIPTNWHAVALQRFAAPLGRVLPQPDVAPKARSVLTYCETLGPGEGLGPRRPDPTKTREARLPLSLP